MNSETLFVKTDGTPLEFYVDPDTVGRPRLIRTIKSAGGSVAFDIKTCDFILVESASPSGQQIITDWAADKIVLESAWVKKSLTAVKLLREEDEWGGCLAVDKNVQDNPLPTPRITPPKPAPGTSTGVSSPHDVQAHRSSQQPAEAHAPIAPEPPLVPQNQMVQFPSSTQQPFVPFAFTAQSAAAMVPPDVYNAVLADVLRNHGLNFMSMNGLPHGIALTNGIQPGLFVQPGVNLLMNPLQQTSNPSQPPGLLPSPHDQNTPSSVYEQLPSASSTDAKGKGRATLYTSKGPSSSTLTVASSSSFSRDKIFTSDSGAPLTFYVSIEVFKRSDVLSCIKRNGGQISTSTSADFAVLASRSKDFVSLLDTVITSHKTAVKPAFVLESAAQDRLLDPSLYQFDLPELLQRKYQKPTSRKRTTKPASGSKQAASPAKPKARLVKNVVVKEERASPGLGRPSVSSPSPPPAHTRVVHSVGKYRYPEVEDQYAVRYAEVLFDRDRNLSYVALAKKLYAKMPHHTEGAWHTRITGTIRDQIEDARKKALIAHRKGEYQQQSVAGPSAKRPKSSHITEDASSNSPDESNLEKDLYRVAAYFANGADSEEPEGDEAQSEKDARIWRKLTDQQPCLTEPTWEEFYSKYHTEVMKLYNVLVEAEESQ